MTKRQKLITIIIISAVVWVGLILFVVWLTRPNNNQESDNRSRIVIIDNAAEYKNGGLSDDFLSVIEPAIYTVVQHNVSTADDVYHGIIRDGSFEQSSEVVSFLLDMPSIKLSWYITQGQSDPSVTCVTQSQAKWPLPDNCVDLSTIITDQSSNTPSLGEISKYLPISDVSYRMNAGYSPTDSKKMAILVTCYTPTCKQDVEAQIEYLEFSPADYQIFYTNVY